MTHENNPATHLIKQGGVLRWKNPYSCNSDHDIYPTRLWKDFNSYATANPIHAIGDWPDKEEFSREEVEIIWQFRHETKCDLLDSNVMDEFNNFQDYQECNGGIETRLAARYKGGPKLSDKIGHINCDPEALKDPVFVKAVNNMAEMAYKMPAKEESSPVEQFRAEVIKKLEAERDNIKKYISPGESSYTFFSFSVRAYEKAIEIVKSIK